ncbi:hypothetical protein IQ241_01670 [Romeria aff. gracilis LEGE 07310]|uniref:Uncharacterized protein n=1 Tax=Vasconcelosia minhoensis LEGE 07310 TaxID=915328 RepID=A0A8J7DA41_9CYAN|nr:hypothetical protein [Romeria gracilis]MBE9076012.1 hypothetical protein [Romeria aff. gracilis LEGE 07310]
MACLTLRPGISLRLKEQPHDLPDFILEKYQDGYCWIYQRDWGPNVHLRVSVAQIAIPRTCQLRR